MHKKRGIIEGYYGPPWPNEVRKKILTKAAEWGYNSYVYGPKDDPYHRRLWRENYRKTEFDNICDLADFTKSLNMNFTFSISPGINLNYSAAHDMSMLLKKIGRFHERGINSFGISFDDIPPVFSNPEDKKRYPSLAAAQNDFLRRVYTAMKNMDKDIELMVCPTQYHGTGELKETRDFCYDLPPEVGIFWTGREVCAQSLSIPDTRYFEEKTGHRPLYWDNYPVNDSVMHNELHLGPYAKRDSGILDYCDGVILNVMEQPHLSMIALKTASDFFNQGEDYNPEESWLSALKLLIDPRILDAFKVFARYNYRSCIYPYFSNPQLMKHFMLHMNTPGWNCGKALQEISEDGKKAVEKLLEYTDNPFVSEAMPWIRQFQNLMELFSLYGERSTKKMEYAKALQNYAMDGHVVFQMESLSTIDKDYFI